MNQPRYHWIARTLAATLAAYAFAFSASVLLCQVLIQLLQTPRAESLLIAILSSFALFIAASFFCFASPSVGRAWIILSVGAVISWVLALLLGFSWGML